ncbi:hypothetical protein SEA_SEPHIROTH_87 [Gordonia Phage Sephiroth]|uniref:Uncharacterized protein n=2 Tax=Octobienvirus TaxID=3044779 RepID=A0AAE8Y7G2_9CAUD|nr:hypothetical protein L3Y23_gp087 [Gordonia Phage Sephiroth]YP_010246608.1 hypothetical protein L3Y24_gp089 [Gordonia phage Kudefre]QNN99427.1 hypothetical protein SEA_SEPHIROTH_87 [Gordonia Phage Sephiroth]UDL15313.1 hypothetical protein SEA_KUDEFRE_89 [Gordonia phage Kudefre]
MAEPNVIELKSESGKVITFLHPFEPGEAEMVLSELKTLRGGFDQMIDDLEKRVEKLRVEGLMEPSVVVSLDEYRARKAAKASALEPKDIG